MHVCQDVQGRVNRIPPRDQCLAYPEVKWAIRSARVVVTHVLIMPDHVTARALRLRNCRISTATSDQVGVELAMLLQHGLSTVASISESSCRSQLTLPTARLSQRSSGCICNAYTQGSAVRLYRLRTPRRVACEVGIKVRQRPAVVSAAVAEHDLADEASEGLEDTSHVQTFMQWLAIQGVS